MTTTRESDRLDLGSRLDAVRAMASQSARSVDQFIGSHLFPLADAIAEVRSRYALQRTRADDAARWFACA